MLISQGSRFQHRTSMLNRQPVLGQPGLLSLMLFWVLFGWNGLDHHPLPPCGPRTTLYGQTMMVSADSTISEREVLPVLNSKKGRKIVRHSRGEQGKCGVPALHARRTQATNEA